MIFKWQISSFPTVFMNQKSSCDYSQFGLRSSSFVQLFAVSSFLSFMFTVLLMHVCVYTTVIGRGCCSNARRLDERANTKLWDYEV